MAINVGKANLVEQLELILSLRGSYPILAIDTEFPGFIRDTPRNATEEERYNDVKHNVDNMHLIQLGVALFDEGGNTPWPGCCWQFNFSDFDPDVDASSPDSIELLVQSGHDFQQNRRHGIDARRCAYLVCVKLFCQPYSSKYVTFHGLYDVAFVIKMITRAPLPNTLNEFSDLVRTIFGQIYDLKYISRFCGGLRRGEIGLVGLSRLLNFEPVGIRHQAAYDSLLIGALFNKMKQRRHNVEDDRSASVLYGMVNLRSLLGGQAPPTPPSATPADPLPGSEGAPLEVEAERPRKKAKAAAPMGTEAGPYRGEAGSSQQVAGKGPRPPSVRDLCRLTTRDEEPFLARVVGEIPTGEAGDPMVACWGGRSGELRKWRVNPGGGLPLLQRLGHMWGRQMGDERDDSLDHARQSSDLMSEVVKGFGRYGRRAGRGAVGWRQTRVVE
ncbi:probable CCR4-associated factor 1 homolog 11 [Musa acuminata AAA Group]|uniref:probable CCR4-associated factor 1 homolog 11 n=1 Tax=Musa acuminata AAA Group TaxID=214697 RepID=UPI0031CF2C93